LPCVPFLAWDGTLGLQETWIPEAAIDTFRTALTKGSKLVISGRDYHSYGIPWTEYTLLFQWQPSSGHVVLALDPSPHLVIPFFFISQIWFRYSRI
jgi:hypothetical protein